MSNRKILLTTERVKDAVRRALEADYKYDYIRADKAFNEWLNSLANKPVEND